MYFSVSRNFWMRAPIEAIPVAPGSSQKVEQKTTGAFSESFGASSGVLVTPNQEMFTFRPRQESLEGLGEGKVFQGQQWWEKE